MLSSAVFYKLLNSKIMTEFLKKHLLKIIGSLIGGTGGFLYYHFVGCASGTCPITSNPYISVIYGAVLGYLLFDLFKKKEKKENGIN
jgi:uncharacterized protein YacL